MPQYRVQLYSNGTLIREQETSHSGDLSLCAMYPDGRVTFSDSLRGLADGDALEDGIRIFVLDHADPYPTVYHYQEVYFFYPSYNEPDAPASVVEEPKKYRRILEV